MVNDPLRVLDSCCFSGAKHIGRAAVLALAMLPSCTVYDASLLDTHSAVTEPSAGDDTVGADGGTPNGGASNPAVGGKAENGGSASPAAGGGASANGGASSGGSGGVSNGSSGGGAGGASGGTLGSAGSAGSAGSGNTGAGGSSAGAPSGGTGGSAAAINPCDRTNWKASASESSTSPVAPPAQAIDGVSSTRWASGAVQVGGEWFLLDLGARAAHLTQVTLDASAHVGDEPLKYKVEVSTDGLTYFLVSSGTGTPTTVSKFTDTAARYIRITQTGSDPDANWWSIQELTLGCTPN